MSKGVGVWIDHKKAVIVSITAGEVTTRTLTSDVGAHPHYSGSQDGGGEKMSTRAVVDISPPHRVRYNRTRAPRA